MAILDAIGRFTDSVVYAFSPERGLKRIAHRAARGLLEKQTEEFDRTGVSRRARLKQRSFKQTDPNEARDSRYTTQDVEINSLLNDDLAKAQMRAVGLYSDNGIARAAVETRVAYEIGAGLQVKPMVKANPMVPFLKPERVKRINDEISELVRSWSEYGVDRSRTMSYGMAQRLMVREFANEGECLILLGLVPYDSDGGPYQGPSPLALEFISPRRLETPPSMLGDPSVRLGIKYGQRGEVLGYYIRRYHPDDSLSIPEDGFDTFDYYPRFDKSGQPRMLHIFDPMFAGQTRGLPWLIAAMNKILDFDDYHEAEIIAKQVEACFGLIFKISTEEGSESLYDVANAASEATSGNELMEKIAPAFIQRIRDTDDVTVVDPARPGASFAPFLEGSLRMIAAATNTPYEILAKNFKDSTFASGRLAVEDGKMSFNLRRSIAIDQGLNPIHRRLVFEAVFSNELYGALPVAEYLANPFAYTRRKYYFRQMGLIQPEREIAAYIAAKDNNLLNLADFHEERGDDWEASLEQHEEEKRREIMQRLTLEKFEQEERARLGLAEKDDSQDPQEDADRKTESMSATKIMDFLMTAQDA